MEQFGTDGVQKFMISPIPMDIGGMALSMEDYWRKMCTIIQYR